MNRRIQCSSFFSSIFCYTKKFIFTIFNVHQKNVFFLWLNRELKSMQIFTNKINEWKHLAMASIENIWFLNKNILSVGYVCAVHDYLFFDWSSIISFCRAIYRMSYTNLKQSAVKYWLFNYSFFFCYRLSPLIGIFCILINNYVQTE